MENYLNISSNDFFNLSSDFLGFDSIFDRKNENNFKFISNEDCNTSRLVEIHNSLVSTEPLVNPDNVEKNRDNESVKTNTF